MLGKGDFQMPCFAMVRGKLRPVNNLRWLVSHWRDVETFKVKFSPLSLSAYNEDNDCIFSCTFGSREVLWNFLDRPIFRGTTLYWDGTEQVCGGIKPF